MQLKRMAALLLAGIVMFTSLPADASRVNAQELDEITADFDLQDETDALEDEALFLSDETTDNETMGDVYDVGSVALDDAVADELEVEDEIEDAASFGTIKLFVTPEESDFYMDEKLPLKEAVEMLPKTLTAVLDDDTTVDVDVSDWVCLSDYDEDADSYEFEPVIYGYEIDETAEVPVVFLALNTEVEDEINDDEQAYSQESLSARAGCRYGIQGNGTNGVSIDINAEPFLSYGEKDSGYGRYAYTTQGCAWFASARVKQLTKPSDKSYSGYDILRDGDSWYYNSGLPTGQTPRANSLACYTSTEKYKSGHVAVVEKVSNDGETLTISESSSAPEYTDSDHGYCHIRNLPRSIVQGSRYTSHLKFLGYVYFSGKPVPNPAEHNPKGCVDVCDGGYGSVRVAGWAFDPDKTKEHIAIHVYIGGDLAGAIPTNVRRDDVNSVYNCGNTHGFDGVIQTNKYGKQTVDIYAINVGEGNNTRIDSRQVNITDPDIKHYTEPTLTISNAKDELGDDFVVRTAILKNPLKGHLTSAGMELSDSNGKIIDRCDEKYDRYPDSLYLYYGTKGKTETHLQNQLAPGTDYKFRIFAFVDGQEYSARGQFKTTGKRKPDTPKLSVEQHDYAVGDTITVNWNAVNYVTNGYNLFINKDDSTVKTVHTNNTSAVITLSDPGEYEVSIVAVGFEDSDKGSLGKTINVHPDSTVTFVEELESGEQNVLKEETVKYGRSATAPTAPSRIGWIFQGWDKGYYNVKEDMTVKAQFTKCLYNVIFKNIDGSEIKREKVAYKDAAVLPSDPPPQAGYVFTGWDSEAYKCVTQNTTIYATYVYENAQLPIILGDELSCEYDSDGTGYTVIYDMTNYDQGITKGRAVVALKTVENRLVFTTESNAFTLKPSAVKNNVEVFLPYEGDAAYAEIVIVDSFSSSIPISEKKTIPVSRQFSSWSPKEPPSSATDVRSMTQYRYRDKSMTVSETQNLDGWTYERSEGYWTDYGLWSDWSRNAYTASDSRKVETRTIGARTHTEKQYYFYKYYRNGWWYSYTNRSGESGVSNVEYHDIWIKSTGSDVQMYFDQVDDGHNRYKPSRRVFYDVEFFYEGSTRTVTDEAAYTQYRCADREYKYRYHYSKWSDWSEWSFEPYTASPTREVETRTVYQYASTAPESDPWEGEQYTVSGQLSPSLAGKQALLVVFKNEEPADYNNEYLGQTVIAEDGSWSFTFPTREIPSVETGDYTVKLGVEGANELLYVKTIEAPKPEYTVRFLDWDGTELETVVQVQEGTSVVPTVVPSRVGYRFVGWNTGLTNVHDNLDVIAMYERDTCTIFFVDKLTGQYSSAVVDKGADIIFPSITLPEGYEFTGWLNEDYNEVTTADSNMVLTAYYDLNEYSVKFYDSDNSELASYTAFYGDCVTAPEPTIPEGQRFAGWSSYDYTSVNRDMELYPSYEYFETTKTPVASRHSATLEQATSITLSCEDDATICYTTDGSTPTIFSPIYTGPIQITQNTVLQFFARSANKNDSEIVTEAYILQDAEDYEGSLMIKPTQYNLTVGQTDVQVNVVKAHPDASIGVKYFSLDESVAVIDENGKLTGIRVGTTQVFAMTSDSRYADYCTVTVTSDEIPMESLTLDASRLDMSVGQTAALGAEIEPANATYQEIDWVTADDSVATVDEAGQITAVGAGTTYITALSHSGDNISYCLIDVETSNLSLNSDGVALKVGDTYQFEALQYGQAQNVTWKTGNSSIATIDETGLLTAVSPGETSVLATTENGEFITGQVRVTEGTPVGITPDAPVIDEVSDTSITVVEQTGCEYSLDAKNWQESNTFVGLIPETNYTVYARRKATGSAEASGASAGTKVKTLDVKFTVSPIAAQTYTGSKLSPDVVVEYKGEVLTKGKDYKVTYKNNTNASATAPYVIISGIGAYTGSIKQPFVIEPKNITDADISVSDMTVAYNGKTQFVDPVIKYGKNTLVKGRDITVRYNDTGYKEPGTYSVAVKGYGNYTGDLDLTLTITNSNLMSKADVKAPASVNYDGTLKHLKPTVKYKNNALVEGTDYDLVYPDTVSGAYVNAGSWRVQVVGKGTYAGTKTVNMTIKAIPMSSVTVENWVSAFTYTGEAITQDEVILKYDGNALTEGEDYTLSYSKNTNVGKATVTYTGKNGFKGALKRTFKINPYDIYKDEEGCVVFTAEPDEVPFAKGGAVPAYTLTFKGTELKAGTDYTVKCTNNKAINDGSNARKAPKAVITGKGNFTGKYNKTFVISEQSLENVNATAADVVYSSKKGFFKVKPVVTDLNGKKLVAGKDYDKKITYKYADDSAIANNEKPDAGSDLKLIIKGKGAYSGEKEVFFRVGSKKLSKVIVGKVSKNYTGEAIELAPGELVIKDGNKTLREGVHFEIVEDSYKRNVNPGTATVKVKGLNDYIGTITVKITIKKRQM